MVGQASYQVKLIRLLRTLYGEFSSRRTDFKRDLNKISVQYELLIPVGMLAVVFPDSRNLLQWQNILQGGCYVIMNSFRLSRTHRNNNNRTAGSLQQLLQEKAYLQLHSSSARTKRTLSSDQHAPSCPCCNSALCSQRVPHSQHSPWTLECALAFRKAQHFLFTSLLSSTRNEAFLAHWTYPLLGYVVKKLLYICHSMHLHININCLLIFSLQPRPTSKWASKLNFESKKEHRYSVHNRTKNKPSSILILFLLEPRIVQLW